MFFTAFTPTYNSANTLHRVYESLTAQTFKDFEWLIIDDGSTDETKHLVQTWIDSDKTWFPIRYIWQENQHKKTAINNAVKNSEGEMIVIMDADDTFFPNTLEVFHKAWHEIEQDRRHLFAGISVLCKYEDGTIVGDLFPGKDFVDVHSLDLVYIHKTQGEKWGCLRVDVLKDHPFPENVPGFVPESLVWNAIGKKYLMRCLNTALRTYYQDTSGISLRHNEAVYAKKYALGGSLVKKDELSNYINKYFFKAPWIFIRSGIAYVRYYLHLPKDWREKLGFWPTSFLGRLVVLLTMPFGLVLFLYQKSKETSL